MALNVNPDEVAATGVPTSPGELLESLRADLREVDHELLEQVLERCNIRDQVFAVKDEAGMPRYDMAQEKRAIQERRDYAVSIGLDPDLAEGVISVILESARRRHQHTD